MAMRHSASIQFLWTDRPMPDRARAAADAGFDAVDLWDWRTIDIDALHRACRDCGIEIGGFFGHSSGGLRAPADREAILSQVAESIDVAERVGARHVQLFSDTIRRPAGEIGKPPAITASAQFLSCVDGIEQVMALAKGRPVMILLEAINTVHVPGYFWDRAARTLELCRLFDDPQLRMAFDCFHEQLVCGRLSESLVDGLPWTDRVDIGNVPGRHQPGVGEIDFGHIRKLLVEHGYDRTVGFETVPFGGDDAACVSAIKTAFPF